MLPNVVLFDGKIRAATTSCGKRRAGGGTIRLTGIGGIFIFNGLGPVVWHPTLPTKCYLAALAPTASMGCGRRMAQRPGRSS